MSTAVGFRDVPDLETNESDSDNDWSDEESQENCGQQVKCIFTGKLFPSAEKYFNSLKNEYSFDIWNLVHNEFGLDFFGYVKLINYLRTHFGDKKPPSIEDLTHHREAWETDCYLKPVIQDDPLLQFMIDTEDEDDVEREESGVFESSLLTPVDTEKSSFNMDKETDPLVLRKMVTEMQGKNSQLQVHLSEAVSRMNEMKTFMKDCILTGEMYRPVSACRMQQVEEEDFEDSGYFGSYSHHDIHAEMLQDHVRTNAYKDAILMNSASFKDKVVLDVGCGTGILSMFAVKSGAKHVYAVDMSDIAYHAMDIVRENHMEDKITVLKGFVEEVDIPTNVDIIISEWMGYFLLYEAMLDSVLFAANKWLNPDGLILPDRCSISLAAVHDESLWQSQMVFWNNVYGFKMESLKSKSLTEASVHVVNPSSIISDPVDVVEFNMHTVSAKNLDYQANFVFKITKSGVFSTIVGYFDVKFENGLQTPISFSTAPWCKSTHWKQTVFFLKEPLQVQQGDQLVGSIDCHKHPKDPRSLEVELCINNKKQTYTIS
uniref:type I protein arginine methyltransferase n=1 Tax=Phallusia mammillata TaxID=59560 RepID=A0A6F9DPR3_9ASCI|nr:protein arginine N-methyltransferase 3-like [Phallusia mammillata]